MLRRPWRFPVSGLTRRGCFFHTTQDPSSGNSSGKRGLLNCDPFRGSADVGIPLSVSSRISTSMANHRVSLVTQVRRHYHSVLSRPPLDCFEIRIPCRRNLLLHRLSRPFHTSSALCYDRLQSLEDAANRDRDNANVQAIFLQVRSSNRL
jgi:hypothetical protein